MAIKLAQKTSIHSTNKMNPQLFLKCACKKRSHFPTDFNSILFNVTKDNNFFDLHNLLEHNAFASKLAKTFHHVMLVYVMSKINIYKRK
jgi:hypothetical protein